MYVFGATGAEEGFNSQNKDLSACFYLPLSRSRFPSLSFPHSCVRTRVREKARKSNATVYAAATSQNRVPTSRTQGVNASMCAQIRECVI